MNNYNQTFSQQPYPEGVPPMSPPPIRGQWRAKMGQKMMAGKAIGLQSLPDWFATYAVATYAIALTGVNLINSEYATEWYFWIFGIAWVAGFFFLSVKFSREWSVSRVRKSKVFVKKLFEVGCILRLCYAVFIFYFYINMTGVPHEFSTADSSEYIETARWFVETWKDGTFFHMLSDYSKYALGDIGYPLLLMLPVSIADGNTVVFLILVINAIIGAYTSIIVYRIAQRSMGETTARIAAIFCMLHPVLICYVGMTLKEVIMTCLVVWFIDMGDRLIRDRKYTFRAIGPLFLVGLSLFLFRTVLGVIAFMSLFFALMVLDTRVVSWGRKIVLGVLFAGVLFMAASETIINETKKLTSSDAIAQQQTSLEYRYGEKKKGGGGNSFAKYASTAVFAPLIFTIPFPTMVSTEIQEDMRLIHGGNWMRNVMSGFVILAMFMLLFSGDWRNYTLPLAMMLGYLVMLAFTQFAHSLRFHIPVMPFEMMFAAYAITNLRKKHRNWYMIWCVFMLVACFAWNWFKLAGRGLT